VILGPSSSPEPRRVMLSVAAATLRDRWVSFTGAFLALALGTGVIAMMALALAATLGTPHQGPQRFVQVQTVVAPEDPNGNVMAPPAAIPESLIVKASTAGMVTADRTFSAPWQGGPSDAVGHGWSAAAFTPYRLTAGHAPADDSQVVLAGAPATLIGKRLLIGTPQGLLPFTVSGVTPATWFEDAVFFTDAEAARLSPPVNALAVAASPQAVEKALGNTSGRVLVLSGDARQQADPDPSGGADELVTAQSMAATTGGIALFVAVFIVIATFAFTVEQRTRELALLRLVGATPRQVRRMVIAEAALIGMVAAALGCVAAPLGAAPLGSWMVRNGIAPAWFHIGLSPMALFIAFVIGLCAALTGAATAAVRASLVSPVLALREAAASTKSMGLVRWLLGIGLIAAAVITGYVLAQQSPFYAVNPRKYAMVPVLYVGGLALLAPVLLRPVAWLATWPLSRLGAGPLLVRQNTLNARRRTAAMVTPIVIAVGLTAALSGMETAGDATKVTAGRQQTVAQYVVVPQGEADLNQATITALRNVPGIDTAVVGKAPIFIGTTSGEVLDSLNGQAVAPAFLGPHGLLSPQVVQGSLSNLGKDYIVVDQRTATEDGVTVGQSLKVWLPDDSTTTLRVAAIIKTGLDGDDTYLSASAAPQAAPVLAWLRFRPGLSATAQTAAATAAAAAVAGQPATVEPVATYFAGMAAQLQAQTRTAATVILGLSVGYSLIAVANTLVMAAAGRRRELAALGLTGATRAQALRMVAGEALLATLIGTILAAICGAALIVTQRVSLGLLVARAPTVVSWSPTWQSVVLCAATAVLASVISANRVTSEPAISAVSARE
jgi:putative ABC transport system permease protein